jgi:hypothetical protein
VIRALEKGQDAVAQILVEDRALGRQRSGDDGEVVAEQRHSLCRFQAFGQTRVAADVRDHDGQLLLPTVAVDGPAARQLARQPGGYIALEDGFLARLPHH